MDYTGFIESKIVHNTEELRNTLGQWRFKEEKIILIHSKSDINKEYTQQLITAAASGTKLVIALDKNREEEALTLAAMIFTDKIILLTENTIQEVIDYLKPYQYI
ncbi:hypothetical protein LJB85_00445 [Porphyromonadaceae bacterium OttesenSCG-928-L07]|nr:hypothetical protein [Porphyromonadaceae bacterium OttesenSCG-928-L07]